MKRFSRQDAETQRGGAATKRDLRFTVYDLRAEGVAWHGPRLSAPLRFACLIKTQGSKDPKTLEDEEAIAECDRTRNFAEIARFSDIAPPRKRLSFGPFVLFTGPFVGVGIRYTGNEDPLPAGIDGANRVIISNNMVDDGLGGEEPFVLSACQSKTFLENRTFSGELLPRTNADTGKPWVESERPAEEAFALACFDK